ncbi:EF-hand domain-containing protein [Allokutzneria sp. NRRL B-24872]|uniref:EF-hand domain-containing protein n=1 Tax=Allokutzneria sp. NRRL B-24872 TaxID=1137961 RepID=UPI001AEFE67F|nr:EF-hand domain-containing protein [Allokutzneria sp. NRRL B-24872]
MTTMTDQKFSALFDWFDQDGDAHLDREDFRAIAGVFSKVAAEDDTATVAAIHDTFDAWWRLLLQHADIDGDGLVSRAEFAAVMAQNVTAPEHFESAVMAIADAVMRAFDTNADGVLSREEYVRLYSVLGVSEEHSAHAFTLLDLDGDGVISHAEYRTAIVEFYLSTDPAAPGNHLLGPVG